MTANCSETTIGRHIEVYCVSSARRLPEMPTDRSSVASMRKQGNDSPRVRERERERPVYFNMVNKVVDQ